jgi:hypothetical protein
MSKFHDDIFHLEFVCSFSLLSNFLS